MSQVLQTKLQMRIDGVEVPFDAGETVFEVTERLNAKGLNKSVPTLCYDDRLESFGACRLCVVEVEGIKNPVASCTTKATAGMEVRTGTPALEKHRKTLTELVVSENQAAKGPEDPIQVDPLRGYASGELAALAERYSVDGKRFSGKTSGKSRDDDENPFILRDYDRCISCYRCVRVCAEQEGDYAISVMNRGFATQITTEFNNHLRDSACTFCGQCVQVCPTGALADRKAIKSIDLPEPVEKTRSICPYCGVGCSVDIMTKGEKIVGVQPAMDGPANLGALCIKGQFAFDFVQHAERPRRPMVRKNGKLVETSWDEALDRTVQGLREARDKHGRHSIYGIASGRAPNESAYMAQKLIRAGFGTNQIDNCSRA